MNQSSKAFHAALAAGANADELTELLRSFGEKGPIGIWEFTPVDVNGKAVGPTSRARNNVTDNGATNMLKAIFNGSDASTPAKSDVMIIGTNGGSTHLTGSITAGATILSLAVAALPGPIAANSKIVVGYGGLSAETYTVTNAIVALGATAIPVVSQVAAANHAINDNCVPAFDPSINPASIGGTTYVSPVLLSAAFDYTASASGATNRKVIASYSFPPDGAHAGNYTEAVLTSSIDPTTQTGLVTAHLCMPPATIDGGTGQLVKITITL